jgi:putative addiction module component (TIGR02574 family)
MFLNFIQIFSMPVDIKEIKKLTRKEKFKLIGEIWDTIEETAPNSYTKEGEEKLIFDRLEAVKNGTLKSDSWENAKKRLLNKAHDRLKPASKNVRH